MVAIVFDASNAPQQDSFDPLPAGWYNAAITNSEMKPTKAGDGSYLSLTFEVVDGPYKGRKVFTNLNLRNPNQVAMEIAYKQLSSICHSSGVIQLTDTMQLHNRPLQMKLKLKPAQGEYEPSNEVTGYAKLNENPVVSTKAGAAAPAFAPPASAPQIPPAAPGAGWAAPAAAQQPAPTAAPAAPAWQPPAAPQPWQAPPAQQASQEAYAPPVQAQPAAPTYAPPAAPPVQAPVPPSWQAPGQPAPQQAPAAAPAAPAAPAPAAPAPAPQVNPPWQQPQQ